MAEWLLFAEAGMQILWSIWLLIYGLHLGLNEKDAFKSFVIISLAGLVVSS